jgi:transposase-like protein
MNDRSRRTFDKAFKVMVVELHKNGKSSREISRDLDIPSEMGRRWSCEYSADGDSSFTGKRKACCNSWTIRYQRSKESAERSIHRTGYPKKGRKHLLQERQQLFRFKKDHQGEFIVEKMCQVFEISRSTYYDWLTGKPSRLTCENKVLKAEIIAIHQLNKGRLFSPKLTIELKDRGLQASRPRVARLMKQLGIKSIICKKFSVMTTDSNHVHIPSENLLNRDFTASEPGKKWVSDLTYVKTHQGWLYLTIIMDLYDRKIIGWAMSETVDASCTVISAFKMAI